jgi:hypothetical protein
MFPLWIETLILLLVAFLIGLTIAWFIWGRDASGSSN